MSVAQALYARGHEVGYYTGGSARALIEGQGMAFFGFDRVATQLRQVLDGVTPANQQPGNGVAAQVTPQPEGGFDDAAFYNRLIARYSLSYQSTARTALLVKAMYREWILGTIPAQMADLEPIVQQWRPDVVVTDHLMWSTFLLLHETRRLPVTVLSFFGGCLLPGPDAPPPGLGWPPPRDRKTRLLAKAATLTMDLMSVGARREANRMRRSYGLPPLRESVIAHSAHLPLHLVCSVPEFDYARGDLPPSVHYVGPCTWDKPSNVPAPEWLQELPTDPPIVYVTEGTAQVADGTAQRATVLRAAVRGLAGLPAQVILSTGRRDPQQLQLSPVPANMRIERYVPHSDLLPKLSLMITNGGSHGVRAALATGLPLVVVPMDWDQYENAQRVVEAGVGLRIPIAKCTPQRLREAVQRILQEPSFRANAQRMALAWARYGNAEHAADLLDDLARRPGAAPTASPTSIGMAGR